MHGAQERAIAVVAAPTSFHRDAAPVGKDESRHVERIGVAVLGKRRAEGVVDRPARVRAGYLQFDQRHAVNASRCRLDRGRDPAIDLRDHRATEQRGWPQGHAAAICGGQLERLLGAAHAGST